MTDKECFEQILNSLGIIVKGVTDLISPDTDSKECIIIEEDDRIKYYLVPNDTDSLFMPRFDFDMKGQCVKHDPYDD